MSSHAHDLSAFRHSHAFGDGGARRRERALFVVTLVSAATMLLELLAGWWTGSLALTADAWHMATHVAALGGAALAMRWSARASARAGFAFGGWKIEVLAAYTSGLALLAVAAWLVFDATRALLEPRVVAYAPAAAVAAIGLGVNLLCAWVLARAGGHTHASSPADDHAHGAHDGHDHNFAAAYLHVLADALTSLLALAALAGGAWFGLAWLDPAAALLGAVVIGRWSLGVLRGSARALVDATADATLAARIRELIEADGDAKLSDLHVWQVGTSAWCAVVGIVADRPLPPLAYRERLAALPALRHVTVEVHRCPGAVFPA